MRLVNRYDVENIDADVMAQCVNTVFSEPQVDIVYRNMEEAKLDGMKVFAFVATEVRSFLRDSISASGEPAPDMFVPHQANAYMVRQLAKSLGLEDRLLALDPGLKNPGSCSIPLTIAKSHESAAGDTARFRRALIAGFGAGFSASAAMVDVLQCGEK